MFRVDIVALTFFNFGGQISPMTQVRILPMREIVSKLYEMLKCYILSDIFEQTHS